MLELQRPCELRGIWCTASLKPCRCQAGTAGSALFQQAATAVTVLQHLAHWTCAFLACRIESQCGVDRAFDQIGRYAGHACSSISARDCTLPNTRYLQSSHQHTCSLCLWMPLELVGKASRTSRDIEVRAARALSREANRFVSGCHRSHQDGCRRTHEMTCFRAFLWLFRPDTEVWSSPRFGLALLCLASPAFIPAPPTQGSHGAAVRDINAFTTSTTRRSTPCHLSRSVARNTTVMHLRKLTQQIFSHILQDANWNPPRDTHLAWRYEGGAWQACRGV